jgi:hypothetical protein
MKRILYFALLVFVLSALPCLAQSSGTLTQDGVSMDIKGVVAVYDAEKPSVRFVVLPFAPSPAEIAKLQSGDTMWMFDKPSPDPKKWKDWCPYGWVEVGWPFDKDKVGDPKKATLYIYGYGIGKQGSNMNVNKFGEKEDLTVTGTVKEGQEVALTAKGSDKLGDSNFSWDVKLKSKLLPVKSK